MGEAAVVPLALLVVAVIQLALAPAQNWISRRMEAEADWKACRRHATLPPRGRFRRLLGEHRSGPDPPLWAHMLLDSHPTLAQRIAMADAWAARR